MNRLELVDRVAERNGITKAEADRIVVSVFEEIVQGVKEDEAVTLIGFGTFKKVETVERPGRNPATGEVIMIPASIKPKFIPGSRFKEFLNEN